MGFIMGVPLTETHIHRTWTNLVGKTKLGNFSKLAILAIKMIKLPLTLYLSFERLKRIELTLNKGTPIKIRPGKVSVFYINRKGFLHWCTFIGRRGLLFFLLFKKSSSMIVF